MTAASEGLRPGFVVAAAGLLLYGLALLAVVLSLPHAGHWIVGTGALLLLAHAAGLWMRRGIPWAFGIAFYGLTGLGYVVLSILSAFWLFDTRGELVSGWEAIGFSLARFTLMIAAPVLLLPAAGSMLVARALFRGRDALVGAGSRGHLLVAILGALGSLALLAWSGFEYFPRDLPARNACAGGDAQACRELGHSDRPFSTGERHEFLRHGCRLGSDSACDSLVRENAAQRKADADPAAQAAPAVTKAEIDDVTTACRAGRLDVCKALAESLLSAGDMETATGHLSFACGRSARFCTDAASLLRKRGHPVAAATLDRAGCDGGHPQSCRALLDQRDLPDEERRSLELRGCLLGLDEVCDRMIARDFAGACDRVCGVNETRAAYVCSMCARKSAILGDTARATAWTELACAHGLKAACRDSAASAGAVRSPSPEQEPVAPASVAEAMRTRLAALMPKGCRVIDARDDNGVVTITGLADSTDCVSGALRALDALEARPELLDIQAQGGKHRFRASLSAAALGVR